MNAEWRTYKLEELCEFINGFAFKSTDYVDPSNATYEVLRMGYINRGGGYKEDSTPVFVPRAYGKNLDKYVLKYGDIAIAMTDMKNNVAILGNTARIIHKNRFVLNQRVGCIRVKDREKLCPIFLYYYSNWSPHIDYLRARANSGVQVNLSTGAIKESTLQLPPLETQQKIGKVLLDFDDKIDLNCRINQTLEAMAQAIFKSWFVDFDPVKAKIAAIEQGQDPLRAAMRTISGKTDTELDQMPPEHHDQLAATAALFPDAMEESELGEIPKGWRSEAIGCYFDLTMGQSPPGNTYNEMGEGIPFYQGRTDFGVRFPTERVYCTAPTRLAKKGDVLVSVRALVGDINVAVSDCAIGRGVAAVRHEHLSFALYVLRHQEPAFKRFESDGTVFGSINKKQFESLPFVVAPDELVRRFQSIVGPLDEKIEGNEWQVRNIAILRDTLLPKLLSGELPVDNFTAENVRCQNSCVK